MCTEDQISFEYAILSQYKLIRKSFYFTLSKSKLLLSSFTTQRKFRTLRDLYIVPLEIHVNEIQQQSLAVSVYCLNVNPHSG